MNSSLNQCLTSFNKKQIHLTNKLLNNIFQTYEILFISSQDEISTINAIENLSNNIIFDKILIQEEDYLIFCIEKTIVIISLQNVTFLNNFFSNNTDSKVVSLSNDINSILDKYTYIDLQESNEIIDILENMTRIQESYLLSKINQQDKSLYVIWNVIKRTILSFIITKSYIKSRNNRFDQFDNDEKTDFKEIELNKNNYIAISDLGSGNSIVQLIYHFELEELLALKVFYNDVQGKLLQRENRNYLNMHYPLIPKFYGIAKSNKNKYLAVEYIKGRRLNDIEEMHFNSEEKVLIILEIIDIIEYIHENGFIYRDMKPDNFIIDENKDIILIDFDRMISIDDDQITTDFSSVYIAPEIIQSGGKRYSYEVDIYSLGVIICFIVMGKAILNRSQLEKMLNEFPEEYFPLNDICKLCININPDERPTIQNVKDYIENDPETLFYIGSTFFEGKYTSRDIDKAIYYLTLAANANNHNAQTNLGSIYYNGLYVKRDINKAIHYFSLAAYQNNLLAQFNLGLINYEGKYISRDIDKAIYYFSLSADQNDPISQYYLGFIYKEGKYVSRDIDKAIHYFSLSANQNHLDSQLTLGNIYYFGDLISRDINKAIHYFSLAANQNDAYAQFCLGDIYCDGQYISIDIYKAIQYFMLSANQNHVESQFNLGLIYYKNKLIPRDINKSIYYFTLAANQNNLDSQIILGNIYYDGEYIPQDISKAIYYYSLAANQNDIKTQYILGCIFYENKYISRDIDKAIHYFTLSADQNHPKSQFILGNIYLNNIYVPRDIDKAIHYFTLSADQNHPKAQLILGNIYLSNIYVPRDIKKVIHYMSLASNQNVSEAQFFLGIIYFLNKYVLSDIHKSIYYLTLAANQNHPTAQSILGFIYLNNNFISRDITKSIHYLTLAANQNDPKAQIMLGQFYIEGEYFPYDINKAIHYFSLAANQNEPLAFYLLGCIYYEDKYALVNIDKAIYYFTAAANKNIINSHYALGIIYYDGKYIDKNIKKAIYHFQLASKGGNIMSNFILGVIYEQGLYVERDINKAIYYYKEGSTFNDQYSKNNLGIIYKNADYKMSPIEYFEEAIRQKGDLLSMFNLGHIYLYGEKCNVNLDKAIELFVKLSQKGSFLSTVLLCLAIVKKIAVNNIDEVMNEIKKYDQNADGLAHEIFNVIEKHHLKNKEIFENVFRQYKDTDLKYDALKKPILTGHLLSSLDEIIKKKSLKTKNIHDINDIFYEGFNITFH